MTPGFCKPGCGMQSLGAIRSPERHAAKANQAVNHQGVTLQVPSRDRAKAKPLIQARPAAAFKSKPTIALQSTEGLPAKEEPLAKPHTAQCSLAVEACQLCGFRNPMPEALILLLPGLLTSHLALDGSMKRCCSKAPKRQQAAHLLQSHPHLTASQRRPGAQGPCTRRCRPGSPGFPVGALGSSKAISVNSRCGAGSSTFVASVALR